MSFVLLFAASNCKTKQIESNTLPTDLVKCKEAVAGFKIVESANNEKATIELYVFKPGQYVDTLYFIKFPRTGNLLACNLPNEYKQDGLQIRFSGKIYKTENADLEFRLWYPIVLTEIELAAK